MDPLIRLSSTFPLTDSPIPNLTIHGDYVHLETCRNSQSDSHILVTVIEVNTRSKNNNRDSPSSYSKCSSFHISNFFNSIEKFWPILYLVIYFLSNIVITLYCKV